eukprot:4378621-Karenia_brevis.AAC.1
MATSSKPETRHCGGRCEANHKMLDPWRCSHNDDLPMRLMTQMTKLANFGKANHPETVVKTVYQRAMT